MAANVAWSFSRLMDYERCPYMMFLKYLEKSPQPPNEFAERGIRVHTNAEHFITGKTDKLEPDFDHFSPELNSLRERFKAGTVEVEEEWAFTSKWAACDWRDYANTWARIKLDAFVHLSEDVGLVGDFKTGKMFGNEIKHAIQGQLYAGSAFKRYPNKKKIIVEMYYLDQKDLSRVEYTPQFALRALTNLEGRANAMLRAKSFPPRPNVINCRYCPFGKHNGTGVCKAAA